MLIQPFKFIVPIDLPGEIVESVMARLFVGEVHQQAQSDESGHKVIVAQYLSLPSEVIHELDQSDYDRVADAIANMSGAARGEALTEMRGKLAVIEGNA